MKLGFQQTHPRLCLTACMAAAVLFSLGIRMVHLNKEFKAFHQLYYLEDNTPLMTTLDAYFYLRIAHEYGAGGSYNRYDPRMLPLLSVTCATVSRATGIPLNKLAFYLPPLLACCTVFIYFLWGRHLGGTLFSFLASLFGMGSYYWYSRTCLGRFDTDSLIPFFTLAIPYFSFRFATGDTWKSRLVYLASALALAYLFHWWWDLGRYVAAPLLIVPYAFSVFFWPSGKIEKYGKSFLLATGIVFTLIIVTGLYKHLPSGPGNIFMYGWLMMMVTRSSGAGLSEVGSSISELSAPTWDHFVGGLAGYLPLLLLSALGFALLLRRHCRIAAMMAAPMLLALASFFSRRLMIFLVPFYAFGLAYFVVWICTVRPISLLSDGNRRILGTALALLLVCLNSARAFSETIVPKVTSYQVGLAESIRRDSASDSVIWNWWDHGYFLQYFAKRKTIIDGGSQYPELMYLTAFPLTVQDPVLAGNWMKLFARGGVSTLRAIDRHFGDMSKTVLFLKEALSRPEDLASILKRHGLEGESQWRRLLFPSTPVYVYLNHDLFEKAPWWYYFGTGGLISGEAVRPRVLFLAPGRFSFDPKKGLILFQGMVQPVSRVYLAQFQPTPRILGSLTFGNAGGPIVVLEKELGVGYLFDASMSDCLFVKLLLLQPESPPPGFRTVSYVPLQGGVWKVE
jgi:dolichyl-diphosphooligosaccharide--protein glycosyltransferase